MAAPTAGAWARRNAGRYTNDAPAIATGRVPVPWDDPTRYRHAALLLDRPSTDGEATADLAIDILAMFARRSLGPPMEQLAMKVSECVLAFLGRDGDSDLRLLEMTSPVFTPDPQGLSRKVAAMKRLAEWV
jgi:hypothetical protein